MCGIAGIISDDPAATRIVQRMLAAQQHRGPDGCGTWVLPDRSGVVIGHRRLAILDLSPGGAQPMEDVSQQFVITFNGEIYNYLELRNELRSNGSVFRTNSDTEVLVEAYKRWGVECLQRLNGMFAFALYDKVKYLLFCARDRYGEKPFLYAASEDAFVFASEYKALLQHPRLSREVDEWRLLRAAHDPSTGLDGDRQTVFAGIKQLLPGEALELDLRSKTINTWSYWQITPALAGEAGNDAETVDRFRELLIDAVRIRLRSDVPVGSCLSGGLDSSAIVCIVRKLIGDDAPYNTFTGRFPGSPSDEWGYATQIVHSTGSISHAVEPSVSRFLDDLPSFVWLNELPVGSSSQFAQWCVFELAKQEGVTVLLDGQGADESLGGYEQYFSKYVEALRERGEEERLATELPMIRGRYPLALVPRSRALRDRLPFRLRHGVSNRLGAGTDLLYGLAPDVAMVLLRENKAFRRNGFDALADALVSDTFGRFLTTLLRYGDRNSMAHSREVRLPFCDHRIAELVFALPPHMLMGEAQTKRLLRDAMRGIVPDPIRLRWRKQGFRPPQDRWFASKPFMSMVRDTLDARFFRESGYWIPKWWERALERVDKGETELGWTIWKPLMIALWRRHFLSQLPAPI